MNLLQEAFEKQQVYLARRHFLRQCSMGLGAMAMSSLGGCHSQNPVMVALEKATGLKVAHHAPKAKRIIFLHMAGGPSQLELFDYKPLLYELDGQDCPQSLLEGKRFAFIKGVPMLLGPRVKFAQHGDSGAWISNLMPHFQEVADDVCFLKAMHTEQFNHAPAQLFMHTGSARLGRPSFGSWVTYGMGSENEDLPGFIVLVSGLSSPSGGKSLWGSGFLPSLHQGVQLRSKGEPVLFVTNPDGVSRDIRKNAIETINQINKLQYEEVGDPETLSRIAQYEMAFKMQMAVPEATDLSQEPEFIHEMYGTKPGESSFANNCLLARRLAERGVRFIQLYDRGWDSHGSLERESLTSGFVRKCKGIDQPIAALLKDLKQRGLLEETLVIWGGEFGRTPMQENRQGITNPFRGRDHHGEAFTMWMAGGGVKAGMSYGETDEMGYYGTRDRVHIHDLQATILHQLGFDHKRLTYTFQGRKYRLTDVHGHVMKDVLV